MFLRAKSRESLFEKENRKMMDDMDETITESENYIRKMTARVEELKIALKEVKANRENMTIKDEQLQSLLRKILRNDLLPAPTIHYKNQQEYIHIIIPDINMNDKKAASLFKDWGVDAKDLSIRKHFTETGGLWGVEVTLSTDVRQALLKGLNKAAEALPRAPGLT